MKPFAEWLMENRQCELPEGNVDASWFIERGLPMIVECCCCTTTMALPNAYIDDEGNIYCSDCAH